MARHHDRLPATNYPELSDWPEYTHLTAQHADLQARYRSSAQETDRLDRTRDTALEADREAYAQALLDGKDDPGQAQTHAHDQAAADKRRECDALRLAVQRTEVTIQELIEAEAPKRLAALESQADAEQRKTQAALAKFITFLVGMQETRAQAAWLRRVLSDGHATSYRGGNGIPTGHAEGLKAPNGYDHTLQNALDALDRTVQPAAPTEARAPGEHVPLRDQTWAEVGPAFNDWIDA